MDDKTLFSETFQYYRQMHSRRWQYLAATAVANSLLIQAFLGCRQLVATFELAFAVTICSVGIAFTLLMIRLTHRLRRRINWAAIQISLLLGPNDFMEVGKPGKLGWEGVTLWVYLALVIQLPPWLVLLWMRVGSPAGVAVAGVVAFLGACVKWTYPDLWGKRGFYGRGMEESPSRPEWYPPKKSREERTSH